MELRQLGSTGLRVGPLALGTMTWARDTDADEAAAQLRDFVDAGGTLLDTAASYADGECEELIGSLLGNVVAREDVQICTKAGVRRLADGTGTVDASRANLVASLDASLRRLGTDHVDVFCVQSPDPLTPLEETVDALRFAVASGRARYVALSNFPAWRTAQAATLLADGPGLAAVEVEYSLVQRGIERELVPAALGLGVGVLAWSPLGRGVLTGKYRRSVPADSRAASAHLAGFVAPYLGPEHSAIVEALCIAAEGLDRSPLDVAIAWLCSRPGVSAAVLGARTPAQLREALDASDLDLPEEITSALDEVSAPRLGYPEVL